MTKKKIWFGNAEKMMWVNCPSTNIRRGRGKWEESGMYLNGGAYQKSSPMSHRKYSIDWNLMESYEAAKIMSYYEGVYGQSPIHFVDPFAAKSNILPLHWSTPRLCAEGEAPSLAGAVETADGAFSALESAPSKGAFFPSTPAGGPRAVIPVPPGQNLYIGAQGGESTVLRTNQARNPAPSTAYTSAPFEVNRNLIPNPTFLVSGGIGTWGARGGTLSSQDWPQMWAGQRGSGTTRTGQLTSTGIGNYLGIEQTEASAIPVTPGQWIAVSALIAGDSSDNVGVRMDCVCFGTAMTYHASGQFAPAPFYAGRRETCVFQVPATADRFRVRAQMFSGSASIIPAGRRLWLGDVQAATAATEAEALAQVQTYFDGSGGAAVKPGMTASWVGTPYASASILTAVPPLYWYYPPSGAFQYMNGNNVLEVRSRNNGGLVYCDPALDTQPTAGQWVAMGVDFKPHNALSRDTSRLQILAYNGAILSGTAAQTFSSTVGQWTRAVHARQVINAGTGSLVVRTLVWPTGTNGDGQAFAVRNYVVAYADTEEEARAMVATRLDGDMPGSNYSWSGVAGGSASIETAGAIRSVPAGSGLKVKDSSGVVRSVPYNNGRATSLTLVDPGTCEVYYTGGFLSGAMATIGTEEPNQNVFRPGEGNTGLRFVGEPTRTGYSSVLDLESVSAEFVEVGAWE